MRMLFIFIDGFGMGEVDAAKNPIYMARTPTHTKNLVPAIIYGNIPDKEKVKVQSLLDITPVVLKILAEEQPNN